MAGGLGGVRPSSPRGVDSPDDRGPKKTGFATIS